MHCESAVVKQSHVREHQLETLAVAERERRGDWARAGHAHGVVRVPLDKFLCDRVHLLQLFAALHAARTSHSWSMFSARAMLLKQADLELALGHLRLRTARMQRSTSAEARSSSGSFASVQPPT